MKYCKKCLQPDTRPDIKFTDDGVCYACVNANKVIEIDWEERKRELFEIAEWAKKNSKGAYDCVVGVSGGKDSTFQAIYAKEQLGLKVLLVNCEPDKITEFGKENMENLINQGFDTIKLRPNPEVMKKVTKKAFYEYGNIIKPSEYPLYASSYIIADKFDIPLIVQGENSALLLGLENGLGKDGDALNVNNGNTLSGGNANDWICEDVTLRDLYLYQFPDKNKMVEKDIKAIYLGYYLKQWSSYHNALFAVARGLKERTEDLHELGRHRRYGTLDSNFQIVNQMLKYYKLGFGMTTDGVSYDIRYGLLPREDGIWIVNEYDGKCGEKYIDEFCEYINIDKQEFWTVTERFINKKLFYKDEKTGKWIPKFKVGIDFDEQ